jgi:hypothetical protein
MLNPSNNGKARPGEVGRRQDMALVSSGIARIFRVGPQLDALMIRVLGLS